MVLGKEGREYRKKVCSIIKQLSPLTERVEFVAVAFMPDRRRRDLDNIFKALFDSLVHAGVIADDSQIDRIEMDRGPVEPPGRVEVRIVPRMK